MPAFRYVKHAVISNDPEGDALNHIFNIARDHGVDHLRVIGWDFPCVSVEQINAYHMHGYEAAWVLPDGMSPDARACLLSEYVQE